MVWVRHEGHCMICPLGHIIMPDFPGIPGTSLGPEALRHILVYCTRRAVDSDISYYFDALYNEEMVDNTIWNARQALSLAAFPAHTVHPAGAAEGDISPAG